MDTVPTIMDMALIIMDMALIITDMVRIILATVITVMATVMAMAMAIVLLVVLLCKEDRCLNIIMAMRDTTITNILLGGLHKTPMPPTITPVLCHHLGMFQHMKMTTSTLAT